LLLHKTDGDCFAVGFELKYPGRRRVIRAHARHGVVFMQQQTTVIGGFFSTAWMRFGIKVEIMTAPRTCHLHLQIAFRKP